MSTLTLGIIVFLVFSSFVSFLMLRSIREARAQNLSGSALFQKLLPLLIADILFVVIFVLWWLRQT